METEAETSRVGNRRVEELDADRLLRLSRLELDQLFRSGSATAPAGEVEGTVLRLRPVRDEIREIAPGLHLGITYWKSRRTGTFALEASARRRSA